MAAAPEVAFAPVDPALVPGHQLERALLLLQDPGQPLTVQASLAETFAALLKGDLSFVLNSAEGKQLVLHPASADGAGLLESSLGIAPELVVQQERQLSAIFVGAAALLAFMQANWTGPDLPEPLRKELEMTTENRKAVVAQLEIEGETMYTEAVYPQLLLGALRIFCSGHHFNRCTSHAWWSARVVMTQQRLLSGKSEKLQTKVQDNYSKAWKHFSAASDQELQPRLLLEWVVAHSYYGEHTKAREKLLAAQAASGFQIKLTGALGMRTKHQTFLTAQLRVDAQSVEPVASEKKEEKSAAKDLPLNDADLLEAVRYAGKEENGNLKVVDQAILLAFCMDIRYNNAKDLMSTEEMAAFVNRALANPNNWMVHSTALLLRCRIEKEKFRTAGNLLKRETDRAVLQLQQLVDQWSDTDGSIPQRLAFIFSLGFPPRWELKRELGEGFIDLGAAATALAIFEELQLWDEIIRCYQIMQKNAKAEEVVRERLKVQPTAHLHCLLGELTGDPTHFETSWEFSGKHYARAQRQWAFQLARAQRWADCIPHFELALAINPLYPGAWFTFGCAAMTVGDWVRSAKAFARVVQLEPEEFEAWANLGSTYVKMGKKEMAYQALLEAVKQNYESWRVWQNLLYVSMDTAQFATAVQALGRIADLQASKLEPDLIAMLVEAISKEEKTSALYRSLSDVMAKIATVTVAASYWGVYADWFVKIGNLPQAYETRLRQMRALQVSDWERDGAAVKAVLEACEPMAELCYLSFPKVAIFEGNVSHLYAMQLSLRGIMRKTQASFAELPDFKKLEPLIVRLKAAEQKVRADSTTTKN